MIRIILLLTVLVSTSIVHAGATTAVQAKVLSYDSKRVKLQVENKTSYLFYKDIDESEVRDLEKHVGKMKTFHVVPGTLKDKDTEI